MSSNTDTNELNIHQFIADVTANNPNITQQELKKALLTALLVDLAKGVVVTPKTKGQITGA